MGVVIRNEHGEVMASLSEKIAMPLPMEVLDMLVARRAAIFARELSFKNVWFERDAEGGKLKGYGQLKCFCWALCESL